MKSSALCTPCCTSPVEINGSCARVLLPKYILLALFTLWLIFQGFKEHSSIFGFPSSYWVVFFSSPLALFSIAWLPMCQIIKKMEIAKHKAGEGSRNPYWLRPSWILKWLYFWEHSKFQPWQFHFENCLCSQKSITTTFPLCSCRIFLWSLLLWVSFYYCSALMSSNANAKQEELCGKDIAVFSKYKGVCRPAALMFSPPDLPQ